MKKNKGFILPVGLIILLITTLIVLLTAGSNITQDKISSASQDREVALQNAEKSLRVAENYIYQTLDANSNYNASCTGGLCFASTTSNVWKTIDWETNTANVIQLTGLNTIPGASKQPKFIIEALESVNHTANESSKITNYQNGGLAFRITTVAWGANPSSKVMLQSMYIKNN